MNRRDFLSWLGVGGLAAAAVGALKVGTDSTKNVKSCCVEANGSQFRSNPGWPFPWGAFDRADGSTVWIRPDIKDGIGLYKPPDEARLFRGFYPSPALKSGDSVQTTLAD